MTRCDLLRAICLLWLGLGLVLGGAHYWTLLPPVGVYLLFAADGIARAGSGWLMPVIRHGDRKGRKVALTFDDGPDPVLTPALLDALKMHGARASFFVIGRYADAHPELIRRIVSEGHELGNHSYSHSRVLNFRAHRPMQQDIERGVASLPTQCGAAKEHLYRPPMGLKNPALARLQRRLGFRVIAWSLHAGDTGKRDGDAIAARVMSRIRPGDIVLFHDGHDLPGRHRSMAVADAITKILPQLYEKGWVPVTVSELLDGDLTESSEEHSPRTAPSAEGR